MRDFQVIKSSGDKQAFSHKKLEDSLRLAGATDGLIYLVLRKLQGQIFDGIPTSEIYRKAHFLLRKELRSVAARYSLKKAVMSLGPDGYAFEKLVSEIFRAHGYEVQTGVMLEGYCVQHEVDVVGKKPGHEIMVECKFHNEPGKICSVQVPLYVKSRFDDIANKRRQQNAVSEIAYEGWIFTNTRFSSDALKYGTCANLRLVGWDQPDSKNLKEMIEKPGLYPVTALTGLTKGQKDILVGQGIILCTQLAVRSDLISQLGFTAKRTEELIREIDDLCLLSHSKNP